MSGLVQSVAAVAAGFVAIAVGVMAATIVASRLLLGAKGRAEMMTLRPTGVYLAVNLLSSAGFALVGGYLTARLAPHAPCQHALVLAGLLLAMAILSLLQTKETNQPKWYGFTMMVLGPAGAALGGWLEAGRL